MRDQPIAGALVSGSLACRYDLSASPGEKLGNFAQAFTEIAQINTAIGLNGALDRPGDHNRLRARILSGMGR